MSKHEHSACIEHAMAWCRHCDVAYCQNCDITWTRTFRWSLSQNVQQLPGIFYNAPKSPPPGLGVEVPPPYGLTTGQFAHAHDGASDGSR